MDVRKITCIGAATFVSSLLIISATLPVHAQPVIIEGKHHFDPETQRIVHYGDLNLTNTAGQKRLVRRVSYAVNDLCGPRQFDPPFGSYDVDCSKAAWDSANPQITAAMERAKSGIYLAADALTIATAR